MLQAGSVVLGQIFTRDGAHFMVIQFRRNGAVLAVSLGIEQRRYVLI